MEWPNDLAAELPSPRSDEPPELRARIVKEVRDHLQCAFERELQLGRDEAAAMRHVLANFGHPARLVRKLWFEAMWGKIMSQRILMGLCGVMTAAFLAMGAFIWKIAAQATEATRAVLEQSRDANQAMLEQSRAWQENLILKLDARRDSNTRPTDPEWTHLKFKLTKDAPDGPPADGYLINITPEGSATNTVCLTEKSSLDGTLDCGLVRAGVYHMRLQTPWNECTTSNFYVRAGKPECTITVPCPGAARKWFQVAPEINWPVDEEEVDLGILLTWTPAVQRNIADHAWSIPNSNDNSMMYLLKNDGSIWRLPDHRRLPDRLKKMVRFSKHCDLGGERKTELPFVEPTDYVLHGIVMFPRRPTTSDGNSCYILSTNESQEYNTSQLERATTGAPRARISLPDELVMSLRAEIARLTNKKDVLEAPVDQQP